ncbi:MAG: TauD/TfdA family dioxygenase [Microthrixaceae bacterium]
MAATTDVEPGTTDPASALDGLRYNLPGYSGTTVGPMGYLAEERRRLDELTWERFEVTRLSATIGGEISGINLADDLDDATIAELRRALLDYKVIFFRDQPIGPAEHVAFARRFGDLEIHPFFSSNPDHPELVRFEKGADTGGYENGWHSDVTWRAEPSMGAVLHAVSVPPTGGDTLFCDMAAVYDGLPRETKERIDDLVAVHDYARAFGHNLDAEAKAEMREQYPVVEHPVVRTHPETGRRLLYVNRFFVDSIKPMTPEDSIGLLDELCRHTDSPEYQCRFHWTNDSVAFWDNRAVQHYAASDYFPDVRIMERASIIGDRPY